MKNPFIRQAHTTDHAFPFIAHFPEKGGHLLLVTAIEGTQIFYTDELIKKLQFQYKDMSLDLCFFPSRERKENPAICHGARRKENTPIVKIC